MHLVDTDLHEQLEPPMRIKKLIADLAAAAAAGVGAQPMQFTGSDVPGRPLHLLLMLLLLLLRTPLIVPRSRAALTGI